MTIKKKDNLTALIQALSANEKRYFRLLFDKSDGDKNYLKIFNAIERNPDITNEGLKKALKKEKVNISYEKAYLQKNILKALRQFHDGSSETLITSQVLSDIEHLFNKGLYEQVLSMIDTQSKWADDNELFGFLLEMLKWKRRTYTRTNRYDLLTQNYQQMYEEEMRCIQRLEISTTYRHLLSSVLVVITPRGFLRGASIEAELTKILGHPYLTDISKAIGYYAIYTFHECHALSYQYMIRLEDAYQSQKQLLTHVENYPDKINNAPYNYITVLLMMVTKCTSTNRYEEGMLMLDKLDKLMQSKQAIIPKALAVTAYCLSVEYKMTLLLSSGRYRQLTDLYDAERAKLETHKESIPKRSADVMHLYVASAYFFLREYETALRSIRVIIDDTMQGEYGSPTFHAYMLNLMIHYELQNIDLLFYLLRAFVRYCKTKNFQQEYTLQFLDLMQELIKGRKSEDVIFRKYLKIFQNLELTHAKGAKYNAVSLSPIGITEWVQSKTKK